MIRLHKSPMRLQKGGLVPAEGAAGREKTMAYRILESHNHSGSMERLCIRFDAMASHDITYVGIIQTARAAGLERFSLPYVLTNCHNSLCAVGGTINEDDHRYGLSAAVKYGGEYVPAHMAVIHQYMRERYGATGRMILCSDSHTRYGAFGTLGVGEGGPELVKQLVGRTWDLPYPSVTAVHLRGRLRAGVGPQDVALALIGAAYPGGFVKNHVLEFIGPGIAALDMDTRFGVDVMTTETTCLSSIWQTDERVRELLEAFGRGEDYAPLAPEEGALYDGAIEIDLSAVEPMIALPFHPSRAYTIRHFHENASALLKEVAEEAREQWKLPDTPDLNALLDGGRLRASQGVVAGCSGGMAGNLRAMQNILRGHSIGAGDFALSVYPASQPMMLELSRDGTLADLMAAGTTVRSAFCGPCFGAGDVPFCGGFSLRHTTRNFTNREGSKPGEGQTAYVALMDARSIAATARNGGILTAATELPAPAEEARKPSFDPAPYAARVYQGVGKPRPETELRFGPNITDWPEMLPLPGELTLTVAAALYDEVTTTDELIPSGDTSSYRSNPVKLAGFALSRREPEYVKRCADIGYGSVVVALCPGDGSAREQAASCQRVLGGIANISRQYATKRYRSNLVNWGMLPFVWDELGDCRPAPGDTFVIPNLRKGLETGAEDFPAVWSHGGREQDILLRLPGLSREERVILLDGCLMNHYKKAR